MTTDSRDIARKLLSRNGYSSVTPSEPTRAAVRPPDPAPAPALVGRYFADHPLVASAAAQFDSADTMFAELGLPNPFYLPHDGTSGPIIRQLGRDMDNFGCFNYLGLSSDPRVAAAAKNAIDTYGTSVSASRIVSGQIPLYADMESRLASIYDVDDAVVTSSGYGTNAAAVGFLLGPGDLAICDSLVHSSVVSGTEWAGCRRVTFRHNDPESLDAILKMSRGTFNKAMVIVEGQYSMDGDIARLPEIIEIARRHRCAVMVDEAHSFGVLGHRGMGVREHFDLPGDAVDVWMGTMSKALGSVGGFIAGDRNLIRALKYSAPGLSMFATAPAPASIAAALEALRIIEAEPDRVQRLRDLGTYALASARSHGLNTGYAAGTSILPVILGSTEKVVLTVVQLLQQNINVNGITYPSVPLGEERLRFFLSSEHTTQQIDTAFSALAAIDSEFA